VGVHAMQVAKILGARVIAVTSNESKAAVLRTHGGDEVIVSAGEFHKPAMALTGGGGALADRPTASTAAISAAKIHFMSVSPSSGPRRCFTSGASTRGG